jgi:hypothetical protein
MAGILLLVAAAGLAYAYLGEDALRAELDRRWPPVTPDQQRQVAIDSAASALKALSAPNVAAGADVATIQAIAFDEVKSKGITKLALVTDHQLLRMTADFDLTLTPEDLPKDSDKRTLVTALAPHVVGEVEMFLTAAASMLETPQRALLVKLLPAVSRVRIDKLAVKGSYDVTAAADAIALLLNRYTDNLSGALSESPFMNVTLPATLQDGFDPSGPIKVDLKEAPDLKLTLSAHPIKSPFRLGAAAWLIDADKVIAMVELEPLDKLAAQNDPTKASFDQVNVTFKKSLQGGLGITDPPPGVWAALGKELVAHGLDSAFAQAQPCLDGAGPIPKETFSAKIPTPDGSGIECRPTGDCTPTDDCTPTGDCTPTDDCTPSGNCDAVNTRDCSACLVHNPFGGCVVRGNDPTCEATKAAQNAAAKAACEAQKSTAKATCEGQKSAAKAICEGQKSAAKAICEEQKTQKKAQCEAKKEGQRLGCETEKGAIVALHRTGNIGNVDGSAAGTGSLKLCFQEVHFGDALDKLSLSVAASGSAALDVHFKFVPLDVGGHILCPLEWTADKNITTSAPPQSVGVSVSLAREDASGALTYQGRLEELPIKLHFQPSPLSLVLQNVNFALACPVAAGLINGLTLGLGPFIPEFLKDYTYKSKPITFSFTPDLPKQSILGHSVKPKLTETPLALILSGEP